MTKLAAAVLCAATLLSTPSLGQYGGYGDGRGYEREDRSYGGPGRTRGSFAASCRDIDQDGPFLSAMCRTRDGDWAPSRIDLRRCDGAPVSNQNGRLRC